MVSAQATRVAPAESASLACAYAKTPSTSSSARATCPTLGGWAYSVQYRTVGACAAPDDALRPAPPRASDGTVAAPPVVPASDFARFALTSAGVTPAAHQLADSHSLAFVVRLDGDPAVHGEGDPPLRRSRPIS